MSIDADLRTEVIAASTKLGQRVHQNYVPQQQANNFPRCWFGRTNTDDFVALDGSRGGHVIYEYAVEAISTDLSDAVDAADAIRVALNGKRGTFGARTVRGVFVDDQADDYVPRGTGEDTGLHVSALRIRVFST